MERSNVRPQKSERKEKDRSPLPGVRTDDSGALVRNTILSSIPEQEYELFRRHLELVDLPQQLILHEPGDENELFEQVKKAAGK